jgi:hypothetical protein
MFLRYNIVDERDFVEAARKMESYRERERNQGAFSTEISTVSANSSGDGSPTNGGNLLQ